MSKTPDVAPPPSILALPDGQVTVRSSRTRMTSPTECRKLVFQVVNEDRQGGRSASRGIVKGCYDGNAPYRTKPPGQAWTANINFLGMEGLIDAARVPYYALFSGVPTYANFQTNYRREEPDSEVWNRIIDEEFTAMLNRWKSWRWHNKAKEFEMLFEGYGVKLREDPTDWRFKAVPSRSVFVPTESPSCLDERIPFIVILRQYRVHELYAKIADPVAAAKRGWNVEAVRWAIKFAAKGWGGSNWETESWEKWEQKLKNHELCGSYTDADIIRTAHVLNQEYATGNESQGKVSHFIVADTQGGPKNEDSYLFSAPNCYENYHEVIIVCFQNTGDGTWHSVRGFAYKSFRHYELQNRTLCRAIDNAFLSAGPILQRKSATAGDAIQLAVIGPVTMIHESAEFVQHRMGADIQGILAVNRVLENNLAQNIGHYNQRTMGRDDGRGEQPTATAEKLRAGKETALSQAQIDGYYDDLDTEYEEMYAVAVKGYDKESRRFLKNCEERGVPKEALKKMGRIKANRLSGYPSPEMRKMHLLEFGQFVPMLPEDGKREFLNELILAFFGPDKLRLLNPQVEESDKDTWDATVENGLLEQGIKPPVTSGMNNVEHLQIHLSYAAEKLTPLKEAMDAGGLDEATLQEAYEYVSQLGPHCDEHLAAMSGDVTRKGLVDLFEAQLKNLVAFHGKLRGAILDAQRMAEQQAMEEQQATALGAMDQARLQSSQIDNEIKVRKAATDTQLKTFKATNSQNLKRWQAGQNMRLKGVEVAHKISLENLAAENQPQPAEK